jgi:alkylation response protein AidB-like acyl-CoA dehydrogenase
VRRRRRIRCSALRDHPVEKWFRDAKVFQIVEGASEIQREIAARLLART